jgi:hypothetical protein
MIDGALIELVLFGGLLVVCWRYAKRLERQNAEHRRAQEAARDAAPDAAEP